MTLIETKNGLWRQANTPRIPALLSCVIQLEECVRSWCRENYHYKGAEIAELAIRTIDERQWRGPNLASASELRKRFEALRVVFRQAEAHWKAGEDYCFEGQCAPADWPRLAA
jgi:hypothetical protein